MFGKTSLGLLRSLTREFRYVASGGKLLDRPLIRLILSEYRSNQVTPAQYCRGPDEMLWVADTYLQYIRSQRICRELTDKHQRREKTVQETADMIGFRLPSAPTNDKHN
ncbi:protein FMC1 homolog [Myzus persicae]|uniref:protein FMC1 homolog n=1 Tax=Myzus persicae TaxID=13164 RepID=UPI000B9314BC|nr:protein FMC1 homolog [Myzus persicae]